MLLRFIQEKEFTPVGGNHLKKVDVRVITATNKSLQELMDRGVFREDLFFRIAETELFLPPLRSRPSDLNLLVPFLLNKHASGRKIRLTQSFLAQLKAHSWRGNVRELENYLKKMLVMYPAAEEFLVDQMPEFLKTSQSSEDELLRLETWEDKNRKQFIQQRLTVLGGNRTRTAHSLGISRQQLIRLIHKYDLT
jgi:transcriptional regulator with PAS, ATPase and Fis domain